ncbi:MAG TPA: DNA gyrase subunit B, partial [Planctomycetaceae bacterium]|nr:DNA gyrase subunit B [Planctomycetaceae bacterium]
RGKILNVEKAQLVKILDNNEIANIFRAIGIPPGAELEDVQKRRYGKVILMTDADVDGSHIRTLLLTFFFRHLRPLIEHGCVYIAQPPLYRVVQKKKTRYVETQEEMMRELVELGLQGSRVILEDGTRFEGEHLRRLVDMMIRLEEPLEALERRGIDLRYLATHHATADGKLPRYRVFLGRDQHWFATKQDLDRFLAEEEQKRGGELTVAEDVDQASGKESPEEVDQGSEERLQVIDLHEVRIINESLRELKGYGLGLKDLLSAGLRDGEPHYPFTLENEDGSIPLSSLRELLPSLRKLGEKGLRITRFKGLGEMDPEELWATTMDASSRVLLRVTMEDAAAADEIFRLLMGDHVEPRREFIEKHALEVRELDI